MDPLDPGIRTGASELLTISTITIGDPPGSLRLAEYGEYLL
jgi:hypothetical protein